MYYLLTTIRISGQDLYTSLRSCPFSNAMNRFFFATAVLVLVLSACGRPPTATTTDSSTTLMPTATAATTPSQVNVPIPSATPVKTTYQGEILPTPQPLEVTQPPPPAWLMIGGEAIPASYGTFCYAYHPATPPTCADYVPPQERDDLVHAVPAPDAQPVVVLGLGAGPITGFEATLQPWTDNSSSSSNASTSVPVRTLKAEQYQEEDATVFTLEPIGDASSQILQVSVTFEDYGDANYLWRLNPSK